MVRVLASSRAIALHPLSQKAPDVTARTVQSILHNTRPNAVTSGYETSGALHARISLIPPAASSMSFGNLATLE